MGAGKGGDGPAALVRRCYQAYAAGDRQAMEGLLSDDFTFSSPWDDHIGRAAYFARCWPHSRQIRSIAIEDIVEHGPDVFVRYRAALHTGKEFRNVEVFRCHAGRIAAVDVYFGRTLAEGTDPAP